MKLLRAFWLFGKWCADCLRDIALVFLWLFLGAILLVQISVVANHQLPMPGWMLRKIETRLNTAGLKIQIGHASIDTTGRLSLEDLKFTPLTFDSPLATVENLRIRLQPLALLAGEIKPLYIRVKGLSLLLPAMFSTSGQAEAVISDFNLAFGPSAENFAPDQVSGRAGGLTFDLHGSLDRPLDLFSKPGTTPNFFGFDPVFLKRYVDHARTLSRFSAEFAAFDHPHLSVELLPIGTARFTLTGGKLETDLARLSPKAGRLRAEGIRLFTSVSLRKTLPDTVALQISCAHAGTTTGAEVRNVFCRAVLKLPTQNEPLSFANAVVSTSVASLSPVTLRGAVAEITSTGPDRVAAEFCTETLGAKWYARADADTANGRAGVFLRGALTNEIIQQVAPRLGIEAEVLLKLSAPAPLDFKLAFGDNWKFRNARGHLKSGYLVGYHVPYNEIEGDIDFDGTELLCHNLAARQGENHATGSYWMNVHTNQFRFLLAGQLRPLNISGYFDSWWPNFWKFFDFPASVPTADVDVAGFWHTPRHTSVFVSADVTRPAMNGITFDRLRTTMFIRPHFYHALSLKLDQGDRNASGSFMRVVDFHRETDDLKTIDFDFTTNLDLQETARIFGKEGAETVEPFTFGQPPNLHLVGHVDGPASDRGAHRNIQLDLTSTGPFALYHFPLNDLSFQGTIRDDEIILSDIRVAFASGRATGTARIHGPDTNRQLSFDCTLKDALLGEAITTLEGYSARSRGEPPPAQSRFQQQNAQGRLNLDLGAQGLYSDPFSYFGHGHMELTSAQLAQVNLLGSLSQLLSKTPLFRFTALQLKEARCSFVLERDKITFPDLKITGTNAVIDTTGAFQLDKKVVDFTARLYPFGQGRNALASAAGFLLVPLTNALELKLSGRIDQPHWRFTYGPTSFLYNITGAKPNENLPENPSAPSGPRKLPQPYLRR
ncbi:MAG: AsmA-like C-terminal region-containing protein [Nibricoccus sp.]